MVDANTTGPPIREAQRYLATWTFQLIANLMAQEATAKLGSTVSLDGMRRPQAFGAGGRAGGETGDRRTGSGE